MPGKLAPTWRQSPGHARYSRFGDGRKADEVTVFHKMSADYRATFRQMSEIRETNLRNSLSTCKTLVDFFRGHSIMLLRCDEIQQRFKTHIEISKEKQLPTKVNFINRGIAVLAMSLKRRYNHSVTA
ncbi:hypothetical protein C8J57DRAFT_1237979 [Mycena rebaudengoi]|nr:hypothetical protein C8J57DRAFT_1237979 [Mycena rebaudengoi]